MVRIGPNKARWDLCELKPSHSAQCEHVKSRRQYNRKDKRANIPCTAKHERENCCHDATEGTRDRRELRRLAERRGDKERPGRECESEEKVNEEDEERVSVGEDAIVEGEPDDHPSWEVRKSKTEVPGAAQREGRSGEESRLTYMIRAESSRPMAFMWLVRRVARSPANAPGSWYAMPT